MASKLVLNWIDASHENSSTGLYLPQATAANFDALVDNTLAGAMGSIRLAAGLLSLCNYTSQVLTAVRYAEVGTPPADQFAQRELKLRFDYVDSAGFKGSFSIPGPDLDKYAQPGSDQIDMQELDVAAFVTAIESQAVSRFDNSITITRGVIVGRNL